MTVTQLPAQTGHLLLDYFYQHHDAMVEMVQRLANLESPSTVPALVAQAFLPAYCHWVASGDWPPLC